MAEKRQDIDIAVVDVLPAIGTAPIPSLVILKGTPDTIYRARQSSVEGTYEWVQFPEDAGDIAITDSGGYYTGTDVETALQEIGPFLGWTTIEEGATGEAVDSKTFSSLTYSLYRLSLYVNQITSGGTVEVQCNGDTSTNYIDTSGNGQSSVTVSGTVAADEHAYVEIKFAKPAATEEAMIVASVVTATSSTVVASSTYPGQWTNTSAKITSITVAPSAGQFGSQTYYKLEGSG